MDVPCTPELAAQICQMTSKESMIDIVTKFDGDPLIFPNVLTLCSLITLLLLLAWIILLTLLTLLGSWDVRRRAELSRPHPSIHGAAPKVTKTTEERTAIVLANASILALNERMWDEIVKPRTGHANYEEMRQAVNYLNAFSGRHSY
jgi:hypothetical protein